MSETPPPRRPLATFLRATPAAPPLVPTPLVPPVEPPEQAIPAPGSALPPATPPPVDAQQALRVPSPAAAVAASPHRATGTPGHDGVQAPVSGETQLPAPGTTMPSASATALAAGRVSDAMGDPPRPASAASDAHASDDGLAPIDAATDDALQDPTARTAPVPLNSAQQRAPRASADADLPSRNAPGTSKALTETTERQVPTAAAAAATQADTIGSERTASTPDGQSHPGRPSSHPDPATTEFGEDAQCDAGIAQSRPSPAQLQP
ncbi:DUF3426 domain-containing protein, partial [Xanthomonas citri pv. citri]|nr:DUF3426 domain-containing protein [Xanthomonas citri pv. citri]